MAYGSWGQQMWLSDRDICHGMERAVLAQDVPFAILNLMSDNPGMRWDIEQTREVIGYQPGDGHAAVLSQEERAFEERARSEYAAMQELEAAYLRPVLSYEFSAFSGKVATVLIIRDRLRSDSARARSASRARRAS